MGVTISSKNFSIDMGYGGFGRLRSKVAELTGKEIGEHLWSDEYCHIGCAYRGLEKLAELGKLALQTEICYWGYDYADGDCQEGKCVRNELCKMRAGVI